jgi:hypothetical protein
VSADPETPATKAGRHFFFDSSGMIHVNPLAASYSHRSAAFVSENMSPGTSDHETIALLTSLTVGQVILAEASMIAYVNTAGRKSTSYSMNSLVCFHFPTSPLTTTTLARTPRSSRR